MRNLHQIAINLPEGVRLAAIFYENYRRQSLSKEEGRIFRIGWSPTYPDMIFWDHYNHLNLRTWGRKKVTAIESSPKWGIIDPTVNISIINLDEYYGIEQVKLALGY